MSAIPEQKEQEFQKAIKLMMPWFEKVQPKLSNATPAMLIDDLGTLKNLIKEAEKIEKTLSTILKTKIQPTASSTTEYRGEQFKASYTVVERTALSQGAAKEYFEKEGILEDFMVTTEVPTLKVTKI